MAIRRKNLWSGNTNFALENKEYCLAIQWEGLRPRTSTSSTSGAPVIQATRSNAKNVDLDLQAVIVNSAGLILDAVYYNNLEAIDGAIRSQGDSTGGPGTSDEKMFTDLSKLPADIHIIVFVVCAYKNHSLREADDCEVTLTEAFGQKKEIARCRIESGSCVADADVIGMMKRDAKKSWQFVEIDLPAGHGSNFLDIIEPVIGGLIRKEIPHAPKFQKVSFNMQKGGVVNLPGSAALKRISIIMDADVQGDVQEPIDIDIAAVFFGEEGNLLGAADSVNDSMFGVAHSGDPHEEQEEHIDESLSIDLTQVPETVRHIFLVLTISNGTFENVSHLTSRIVDQASHDLAFYEVPAGHCETGLVVARLFFVRTYLSKRWALHAVGKFFSDEVAAWSSPNSQHQMLKILHKAHPDKVPHPRNRHTFGGNMMRQVSSASSAGDSINRQISGSSVGGDQSLTLGRQVSSASSAGDQSMSLNPSDFRHQRSEAPMQRQPTCPKAKLAKPTGSGSSRKAQTGAGHGIGNGSEHGARQAGSADSGAGHGHGHICDHGDSNSAQNGAQPAKAHPDEHPGSRKADAAGNRKPRSRHKKEKVLEPSDAQKASAPESVTADPSLTEAPTGNRPESRSSCPRGARKSAFISSAPFSPLKGRSTIRAPVQQQQELPGKARSSVLNVDLNAMTSFGLRAPRIAIRKKGGLRLNRSDNPVSPISEAEESLKVFREALVLASEDVIPVACPDEAETVSWRRCDDCRSFGFFTHCGGPR